MVATDRGLPAALYWEAVRTIVPVARVRSTLLAQGAWVRTAADDRGIVGAAAAIAWPGRRRTWELISYRDATREGRPRVVSAPSVRRAQRREPTFFLCEDLRTRRLLVTPHTPCPILFGLRGSTAEGPLRARRWVRSEPVDRWVLFRTNQGTGDHLRPRTVRTMGPYESGTIRGTVESRPEVLRGGHVRFDLRDRVGDVVRVVAFEPTKTLPRIARSLVPGDRVAAWGARAGDPAVRLEGIRVERLAPRPERSRPPRCPNCAGRMHSVGAARGYRCETCRTRLPPESARRPSVVLRFGPGVYHPTPSARRHLAPLGPEP